MRTRLIILTILSYLSFNIILFIFQDDSILNSRYLQDSQSSVLNFTIESEFESVNNLNFSDTSIHEKIEFKPVINTCKTPSNKYTDKEIFEIFRYKTYSKCKINSKNFVKYENNTLHALCGSVIPTYAVDHLNEEFYAGGKREIPKWSSSIPNLVKKQFVLIKCSNTAIRALVFLWYNENISRNKREISVNLVAKNTTMNVLVLVLDSVSRFSSQRNLEKTTKFLKNLHIDFEDYYDVFEFDKVAIPHARTAYNIAQLIYGESHLDIYKKIKRIVPKYNQKTTVHSDYQKHAIWTQFNNLGYVTMVTH